MAQWYTWVFSGVGVLAVTGVASVAGAVFRRRRRNAAPPSPQQSAGDQSMLAGGNITVGGDVNYNYIPDNLITGIADEVAKRLRAEQVSPPRDNRDQVKHELVGAINDLPEQEKVVVTLHYFEGLEFSEVAKVLGLSVDDTRGIHRIALQQIAAAIALSFLRDDYE